MGNRKAIGQKTKFEVFKRDNFTCQYCGRSAPEVILEVDHIKPVAEGGTNDILNLITACRDCNRGKGKTELSDDTAIARQKAQMEELNDRRQQLEMMVKWREGLKDIREHEVEEISDLVNRECDHWLNDLGEKNVRKLIRRFGFDEVYTAVEIAFEQYYEEGDVRSIELALDKVGGICYNRSRGIKTYEDWRESQGWDG